MKTTQNLYLKTMYLLELKYGKIRVTDIAKSLGYTKSSVSKALVRLANNNLICYEAYKDIVLCETAIEIAEELIMKENLLEIFFEGILNITENTAKEDIAIISEYVSKETNEKLKEFIIKTLKLNNEHCKCNMDNPMCHGCDTKILQNRVTSNEKWIKILKEEE